MSEQVHETIEPIRPEDVPAGLIDAVYPTVLAHSMPWHPDAVRILAAALLTEACEQIAQAVETACTDEHTGVVEPYGDLAAAVVRSWPEELDA
ncbi:hypothetical protein [Nonomuraea sp. NPDC023979]|uniref:hypothetical protein n=1 Tax=Nonomuraea sp. NPDC023979 TaxID=3154796 RepID=UPI0033EAA515